jgi:hypothetical protein
VILLDVNVWLAATWGRHRAHPVASAWFDHQAEGLVMCRVAQMGLLRLLSNASVLGPDVLTRAGAWRVVDRLMGDDRVLWQDEPPTLEAVWRATSARDDSSHRLWTDDYLAAFAQSARLTLATLDQPLPARYPSVDVVVLAR